MKKFLLVICFGFLFSACTWVKVTYKGEAVRLVHSASAVDACKKIGSANTKVVDRIIFDRDAEKVAGELADLARNEAGALGGDTILPTSSIIDGRRSFDIYRCFQSLQRN